MSKWNEENVLYFASNKLFEVDKEARTQKDLRRLINKMVNSGFLKESHENRYKRYYRTTEKGAEKSYQYKLAFKNKSEKPSHPVHEEDSKGFHVYFGYDDKGCIVYIGTTIQKPSDRWRWHKHNGKSLNFKLYRTVKSKEEMLSLEFELIKKHKPKLNKITDRPQNLNVKLTKDELDKRVGDKEWCQSCLKRRAKVGANCRYCN